MVTGKTKIGQASRTAKNSGDNVAQNHYSSKTKRRPKNNKRKDSSAQTMAALRKREAAEKK
jgi:hypothetical protein